MFRRLSPPYARLICVGGGAYDNRRWTTTTADKTTSPTDPQTWPKDWTSADIQKLLRDHLSNPKAPPNYDSFAVLHNIGDYKSLAFLLKAHIKPPAPSEVDIDEYLSRYVNNIADSSSMPVQERTTQLDALVNALSAQRSSENRIIVYCTSPRGTGKTQFLKWAVFMRYSEAMRCGRVIVRCCDKAAHDGGDKTQLPWITQVLEDRSSSSTPLERSSVDDGLCELIRTHVESVTGSRQDQTNYRDPHTAYATWMSETARHFNIPKDKSNVNPLIILDTCEILSEHDHKSLVHKH
ncbi:Bodo-specific multi-copy gene family, putative, partial [Bodo saltans]